MADIDSYLLKCTLESIENGVQPKDILKNCECQMGFTDCKSDNDNLTLNNGEKQC